MKLKGLKFREVKGTKTFEATIGGRKTLKSRALEEADEITIWHDLHGYVRIDVAGGQSVLAAVKHPGIVNDRKKSEAAARETVASTFRLLTKAAQ